MKLALKIISWFGVTLVGVGAIPSYTSSLTLLQTRTLGSGVGYFLTFLVGLLGALMIVAGAFTLRHKSFGIAAIIVGAWYTATFFGYIFLFQPHMLGGLALMVVPGLTCIVVGTLSFRRGRRTGSSSMLKE